MKKLSHQMFSKTISASPTVLEEVSYAKQGLYIKFLVMFNVCGLKSVLTSGWWERGYAVDTYINLP